MRICLARSGTGTTELRLVLRTAAATTRHSKRAAVLPVSTVQPAAGAARQATPIVLLHGMWHGGAWHFAALQRLLAAAGFESHSVDLRPGARTNKRGGTRKELVADLSATLDELRLRDAVLIGHSQGGLVAQSFMQDALPARPDTVAGAVLLGTFPLGLFPPAAMMLRRPSIYSMLGVIGYSHLSLTGLLRSTAEARSIFVRPDTIETTACEGGLRAYFAHLAAAPPDGWLTMTHFVPPHTPSFPAMRGKPVLVLGGADDIIYPPTVLARHFDARFPSAEHIVASGQAHCFVDAGWEASMVTPLIAWLRGVARGARH